MASTQDSQEVCQLRVKTLMVALDKENKVR